MIDGWQRDNVACVIGQKYEFGEDQKILTRARYAVDPMINYEQVWYWGIRLSNNYEFLMAEYLLKKKNAVTGSGRNMKLIGVLPSEMYVKEHPDRERIEKLLLDMDKVVYMGGSEEEVWKHLLSQSGHMITYCHNVQNVIGKVIREAFKQGIKVTNCGSMDLRVFRTTRQ